MVAAPHSVAAARTGGAPSKQAPPLLLAQLEALEDLVSTEGRPTYMRPYAWFKLLRFWTSMRWDDTQGLRPHRLERRARGLFGVLERTKTSGPGKHLSVLPVFVSQDAWLKRPWLDAGLALWWEEDGCYW